MKSNPHLAVTRLAFLDETTNHFNSKNRGFNVTRQSCSYSHADNGGCAIGRKCSPELAENLEREGKSSETGKCAGALINMLPLDLQTLGGNFLNSVQALHDYSANWDDNGLTDMGKDNYEKIKMLYS